MLPPSEWRHQRAFEDSLLTLLTRLVPPPQVVVLAPTWEELLRDAGRALNLRQPSRLFDQGGAEMTDRAAIR